MEGNILVSVLQFPLIITHVSKPLFKQNKQNNHILLFLVGYMLLLFGKTLIPLFFFFNLDIKKDMLSGIGKILSIAILLILEHNKFGTMWVTIMSID